MKGPTLISCLLLLANYQIVRCQFSPQMLQQFQQFLRGPVEAVVETCPQPNIVTNRPIEIVENFAYQTNRPIEIIDNCAYQSNRPIEIVENFAFQTNRPIEVIENFAYQTNRPVEIIENFAYPSNILPNRPIEIVENVYQNVISEPFCTGVPLPAQEYVPSGQTILITDCSPSACQSLADTLNLMIVCNMLENTQRGKEFALQLAGPVINQLISSPVLSCGCPNPVFPAVASSTCPNSLPNIFSPSFVTSEVVTPTFAPSPVYELGNSNLVVNNAPSCSCQTLSGTVSTCPCQSCSYQLSSPFPCQQCLASAPCQKCSSTSSCSCQKSPPPCPCQSCSSSAPVPPPPPAPCACQACKACPNTLNSMLSSFLNFL